MRNIVFTPIGDTSSKDTPGTSSTATALSLPSNPGGGFTAVITNNTNSTIFVKAGISTVSASASTAHPVLTNDVVFIDCGPAVTHIACCTASGTSTGTIYFTPAKVL